MLSLKYRNLIKQELFEYRTRGVTKAIVKRNLTFKINKLNTILRLYNLSDSKMAYYKKEDEEIVFIIPVSEEIYNDSKAENSYYMHNKSIPDSFYIDKNINPADYNNKISEKCFNYLEIFIKYLPEEMVCEWSRYKSAKYAIVLKQNININFKDVIGNSFTELHSPEEISKVFNKFYEDELIPLEQEEKPVKNNKKREIIPLSAEDIEKFKNYNIDNYFENYINFSELERKDLDDQYRHGSSLALYNVEEEKNPGANSDIILRPKDIDGLSDSNQVRLQADSFFNINSFNKIDRIQVIGHNSCNNLLEKEYIRQEDFNHIEPHESDETISIQILREEFEKAYSSDPAAIINVSELIKSSKYGKNIKEGDYSNHEVIKMLDTWATEMLCPLALLTLCPNTNSINWGSKLISGKNVSSRDILINLFDPNHTGTFKNALIAYPKSGELLYDSKIAIPSDNGNYKMIYISSKGGLEGVGAPASMKGLYDKIVYPELFRGDVEPLLDWEDSNKIINFIKNNEAINPLIKEDLIDSGKFINEFGIIYIFSSPKIANETKHNEIVNTLINKRKKWLGIDFSQIFSIQDFTNYLNNSNVGKAIITLLDYQKFDFAQMDVDTNFTNELFNYRYSIQYPAIFKGRVDFSWNNDKKLIKFHILGD